MWTALFSFLKTKTGKYILAGLGVGIFLYVIYYFGKKQGGLISGGTGSDIPPGWTATEVVLKLINYLAVGAFTVYSWNDPVNDEGVVDLLTGLSRGQRIAVYNEYLKKTGRKLTDDMQAQLDNASFSQSIALFDGII